MRLSHRLVPLAGGALLGLTVPVFAAGATPREDSNALIMTAEIALQRNNCGRAADSYVTAAQRLTDVKLAQRAAQVALDCGQYAAADRAVARWRQLAPQDPAALHAGVRTQLGLYHVGDAAGLFENWLKSSAGKANAAADELLLLSEQAGASATFAMARSVHDRLLNDGKVQLAVAALGFDSWNYRAALQYAQRALTEGADKGETHALMARANAGLGEADAAIKEAQSAKSVAPADQGFIVADVLHMLGRDAEARQALAGLEDNAKLRSAALRRLALMAFDRGDYDEAESGFEQLLNQADSQAVGVFYLAAIAERRGEDQKAFRGYQLLSGTALEGAARSRAAALLFKQGDHGEALKLLAAADDAEVAAKLAAEMAQAQLLATEGAPSEALARIDDALDRYPAHPELVYQRCIYLERAGRTDAAVAQLETLYHNREHDASIANALGFILVDHNRDLARAARLIGAALADEPDNPAILDSMGWLEFRRGAAQAALPLLERAYRLEQDGDIGAHWGEVLWSLGEKSQARQVWTRAFAVDPDNEALKSALQRSGGEPAPPAKGTAI
jgi:tetratricopeptide (TPR) repeat protein